MRAALSFIHCLVAAGEFGRFFNGVEDLLRGGSGFLFFNDHFVFDFTNDGNVVGAFIEVSLTESVGGFLKFVLSFDFEMYMCILQLLLLLVLLHHKMALFHIQLLLFVTLLLRF